MTANLFTELEHFVSDYTKEVYATLATVLKENGQLSARIDQLEAQLAECQAERDRARGAERLLLELTPGGSEFHGSPGICANWIRDRLGTTMKIAKERNRLREAGERLAGACETARKWLNESPETQHLSLFDVQTLLSRALADWRGQQTGEPEA